MSSHSSLRIHSRDVHEYAYDKYGGFSACCGLAVVMAHAGEYKHDRKLNLNSLLWALAKLLVIEF